MRDGKKKEDEGKMTQRRNIEHSRCLRQREKETDETDELDYSEVMKAIGCEGQKRGEGKSKIWYSVPYIFLK